MEPVTATAAALGVLPGAPSVAMSPTELALMLGPVIAHVVQPVSGLIPAKVRPLLIGLGAVAIGAAATSAETGAPFKACLAQGVGTALAAKVYHAGVLKQDGFLVNVAKAFAGTK